MSGVEGQTQWPCSNDEFWISSYGHPDPVRDAAGRDLGLKIRDRSADDDWKHERKIVQSRTKDLVRNNEMAYGSLDQHTDAVTGKRFRLQPEPNARMLGWEREPLREFVANAVNLWKVDSASTQFWMDVAGEKTFTQLVSQHVRTYRVFGESFMVLYNRTLPELRPYGTAAAVVDPGRVYTPKEFEQDERVCSGIRRSGFGYPAEYFVHDKHPGSQGTSEENYATVTRRNKLGRDQIIHSYLQDMPGLGRGVPAFAPALKRLCSLGEFQENTLDAAAWQATVAATLYSDHADGAQVFNTVDKEGKAIQMHASDYQMQQAAMWNKKNGLSVNGVQAKQLWTGERLEMNSPGQPIAGYAEFEHSMLKHFARALGTSVEWLTQDWSNTSFSGARAGLITTWRRIETERANVAEHAANGLYANWMEDNIANGRLKVPGLDDPTEAWVFFLNNRDAMTCASWFGPVKEEIDRSKTADFYKTLLELGILTKSQAANELTDQTGQEIIDQQVEEELYELQAREDAGLPPANGNQSSELLGVTPTDESSGTKEEDEIQEGNRGGRDQNGRFE